MRIYHRARANRTAARVNPLPSRLPSTAQALARLPLEQAPSASTYCCLTKYLRLSAIAPVDWAPAHRSFKPDHVARQHVCRSDATEGNLIVLLAHKFISEAHVGVPATAARQIQLQELPTPRRQHQSMVSPTIRCSLLTRSQRSSR